MAILVPARVSSRQFVAASLPDLKRLEPSVELLSVPLDVRSPTSAVGTVVGVIGLSHHSVTSRSLVEAMVPGLKQLESPSTNGTDGWLRTLCVPTRPRLMGASVGRVKLAPSDVMNPTGILSRPLATADVLTLTWLESPVAQLRLPGGQLPSGWTSNR